MNEGSPYLAQGKSGDPHRLGLFILRTIGGDGNEKKDFTLSEDNRKAIQNLLKGYDPEAIDKFILAVKDEIDYYNNFYMNNPHPRKKRVRVLAGLINHLNIIIELEKSVKMAFSLSTAKLIDP